MAGKLFSIYLITQTDTSEYAASSNKVSAYYSLTDKFEFDEKPPAKGKVNRLRADASKLDIMYEDFVGTDISLTIDGQDAWAPRSAFMYCAVVDYVGIEYRPLAHNLNEPPVPKLYISRDSSEGQLFWPTYSILPLLSSDQVINRFVLYLRTNDSKDAGSSGPFEFSVFGKPAPDSSPCLMFQTSLTKMGNQAAAERGEHYLADFKLNVDIQPSSLISAEIRNKGDNAWFPAEALLFGLAGSLDTRGVLLGKKAYNYRWISQDPHDYRGISQPSGQTLYIDLKQ